MMKESVERLQFLCDTIPALLSQIKEDDFSFKPTPDKWGKKEILGHLIDSATNNHHRFVRGQFEEIPTITYNQNKWNSYSYYNEMDSGQLISFWEAYNRQLLALIQLIPISKLANEVNTGGENNVSIAYLVEDYVAHLEHHLQQITAY